MGKQYTIFKTNAAFCFLSILIFSFFTATHSYAQNNSVVKVSGTVKILQRGNHFH